VLLSTQPIQGNPNDPELAHSEFGNRHRIVASATYTHNWSERVATQFGLVLDVAEGNRFAGAGGNRYSFIYAGDVNGDGFGGNDLIYIPSGESEIRFDAYTNAAGETLSAAEQWARLESFIDQDSYLSGHRGEIAERFGAVNPWFSTLDLRVLQDFSFDIAQKRQTIQLNFDVLNLANLLNSDWGVRQVASPTAQSPLQLVRFAGDGEPVFNFTGPDRTFIDDPGILSRWQVQFGVKYLVN
jgi:hypothetical protein